MTGKHLNIAFYQQNDWKRLLSIVDDRESLHETWEQWHHQYLAAKRDLESQGFRVNPVVVDLDKLIRYCFQRGIKNDGKARSQFVSEAPE